MASRTCLRSIGWIDGDDRYAGSFSLVFNLLPKVREIPLSNSGTKFLSLIIGRFLDAFELFNGNTFVFRNSLRNNFLCNSMVHDRRGSFLFSRKPFQDFFRALRAFGLETRTDLLAFFSICFKFFAGHYFASRKGSNVNQTEIHTDKFFNVFNSFFWNFHSLQKKKLATTSNKVGLTLNEGKPVGAVADKRNLQSAIDSPDRNRIVFVGENPGIISYCTEWFKLSLNFLIKFVRIRYLGNTPNSHLRRKPGLLFNKIIRFLVKFELVEGLFFPRYFRNSVAGRVCLLNSIKQELCLTIIWKKLNLQYQLHDLNILLLFEVCKNYFKKGDAKIPPTVKTLGFLFA